MSHSIHPDSLTRRRFLVLLAEGTLVAALPGCSTSMSMASPDGPPPAGFLDEEERRALALIADHILPPDDTPGAAGLGTVEYIDGLLDAFATDPPRIFAGGPYSGRAPYPAEQGGVPSERRPVNDFRRFLPLDRVSQAAWRLRLYGSAQVPGPNDQLTGPGLGPVTGLRDLVRQALSAVRRALPQGSEPDADAVRAAWEGLPQESRAALVELVLEAVLAAPEYGGNRDGGGWQLANYPGDQHPLGYSIYDPALGASHERPEAPLSTADPGPDPAPLSEESHQFLRFVTLALGGRVS